MLSIHHLNRILAEEDLSDLASVSPHRASPRHSFLVEFKPPDGLARGVRPASTVVDFAHHSFEEVREKLVRASQRVPGDPRTMREEIEERLDRFYPPAPSR